MVSADLFGWGWRIVFAVNIPVGVVALLFGARFLPVARRDRSVCVDFGGAVLAAVALVALTFPLVEGRDYDWVGWLWGCFSLRTSWVRG